MITISMLPAAPEDDMILKAINVTKQFGALKAVDDLSFEVQEGQIFGIAGPNGAGKSTVYNLITGFYPYEGAIEFDGRNTAGMPPYRIAKAGIARTFQIPQVFPSLTVEKSISVGSRFGARGGLDLAHVDEVIRFVDLEADQILFLYLEGFEDLFLEILRAMIDWKPNF